MADYFSYLSILNPGFPAAAGSASATRAGAFAYVSFLNPPVPGGGGGSTVTVTVTATHTHPATSARHADAWGNLGVYLGSSAPVTGIQYSEWLAGSSGYFMWIRVP